MRTFVAGLAVFLSFFTGAVALVALPAQQVHLDPDRAGEAVANALQQDDLREQILGRLVPGYTALPEAARDEVDRVAEDPATAAALSEIRIQDDGRVDLAPLQVRLSDGLRERGRDRIASRVDDSADRVVVEIPAEYFDLYATAREQVSRALLVAGLATLLLYGLALLASRERVRTVRSIGLALLLSTAVAAGLHWAAPAVVEVADINSASAALALTLEAQRREALMVLAPFAVVALLAVVAGIALGRRTRDRYDDRGDEWSQAEPAPADAAWDQRAPR